MSWASSMMKALYLRLILLSRSNLLFRSARMAPRWAAESPALLGSDSSAASAVNAASMWSSRHGLSARESKARWMDGW